MDRQKAKEVLEMVRHDVASDAKNFDGQPFTGPVVARYFGNHGAAIDALARILSELLEEQAHHPGINE